MYRPRILSVFLPLILFPLIATTARAQQRCPAPPVLGVSTAPNIFTPRQEVDLGDVEAERIEQAGHVFHDDQLTAYLNRVMARLLAQLPPTELQFRVFLVDEPAVDSYSLPGGRIYVTRKMVAFTKNEDETAGLLGHEMGHILTHQLATDMTRLLRSILGVTAVGDRKDIFDKFNRFLDNAARNPKALQEISNREEPQQYQADQVALYAAASAGYSPQSFADFFDRLAQTKGKTGDFITDLFGMTKPDEKRLRLIRKSLEDLPPGCRNIPSASPSDEFRQWQADVIGYSGLGNKEALTGLMDKKSLDPPLRSDISNVKFSPDGKYLLAQDDSSVFVLSRDPLHLLFRVDAQDSHPAQFTPDSQSVVFDTRGTRVEAWRIADGERTSVHELALRGGCIQSLLSPDGQSFACINRDFDLSLYDAPTGNLVFSKKGFFYPSEFNMFPLLWQLLVALEDGTDFQWARMAFSPDAKTFLGAAPNASIAVSLVSHEQISLHGALSSMVKGGFAFLTPDRVIAIDRGDIKNSAIFKFPSGEVVERLVLGGVELSATSHGNDVIVGPLKDYPAAVLNLSLHKLVFGSKETTIYDVYDDSVALEARNGEIALYNLGSGKTDAQTSLSLSPLGTLRAVAVSPDLKWVALSGTTRGAVWNITTAKRLYFTRGFRGAYFDGDTTVFADFPERDKQARSIARMDLEGNALKTGISVDEKSSARQWGPYLVYRKPAKKGGTDFRNEIIEVRDVRDGNLLWTRTFPKEIPTMTFDAPEGTVVLAWQMSEDAAKDEIKRDPALQARLATLRDRKNPYVLEVLDLRTGKQLGALIVDTGKGSFDVERAYAAGDWVVVADSDQRTLVYSLSSGDQKGVFFGARSVLSPSAGMLSVENAPGRVDLYAVPSFEKRGQLVFASPLAIWSFSGDGKRLFVLTEDQTAYTFDASRINLGDAAAPISAGAVKQ
ncbi:MAG TPA: M48 family metalloprotease [Candidatus Acidoferrales bacterium]|nr:M48 family metalloprotease [Candidatus Acidoferrales bacterium]